MDKPEGKFLCYDQSSSKDVRVNLLTYDDGSRAIQLSEEPDKPFQTGIAIGNPTASAMTTKRTAEFGMSKNGKT
jgi:hypothetical protein